MLDCMVCSSGIWASHAEAQEFTSEFVDVWGAWCTCHVESVLFGFMGLNPASQGSSAHKTCEDRGVEGNRVKSYG